MNTTAFPGSIGQQQRQLSLVRNHLDTIIGSESIHVWKLKEQNDETSPCLANGKISWFKRPLHVQLMSTVSHVIYWFILVSSINNLILANIYPSVYLWGKIIKLSKLKVRSSLYGQRSVKYKEDLKDPESNLDCHLLMCDLGQINFHEPHFLKKNNLCSTIQRTKWNNVCRQHGL